MTKIYTFADEKNEINNLLNKKGDMSIKEKERLLKRIENYRSKKKALINKEEVEGAKIIGPVQSVEFDYEVGCLEEEVTPFKKFEDKVNSDLQKMD